MALALVLFRNAWVCDDAYITFRTVDNWVNGYGLTWNVAERVQSYTHPLWMFVFSAVYACTHEAYLTSIALGAMFTCVACLLLFCLTKSNLLRILAVCTLLASKAFVDYASSGLENSLSYALVGCLCLVFARSENQISLFSVFLSVLISSFLVLNRMDYALLVGPVLLALFWSAFRYLPWWKVLLCILAGGAPFAAWEVFSVIYYGFPFPNTAYAKLNTGISTWASCGQGMKYVLDSWQKDTATQLVICAGVLLGLLRAGWTRYLALGCLLYLAYVVRIGGDFMSGRFFAVPFLCCVATLIQSRMNRFALVPGAALLLALGWCSTYSPLKTDAAYIFTGDWRVTGISDERGAYYQQTGLLNNLKTEHRPNHQWLMDGSQDRETADALENRVIVKSTIGFYGYAVGPDVRVVDELALADSLLARLPARDLENWRIGHFWRTLPDGYVETLRTGENQIADPKIADQFALLQTVVATDRPIWSCERLKNIWLLNTKN